MDTSPQIHRELPPQRKTDAPLSAPPARWAVLTSDKITKSGDTPAAARELGGA